MSEALESCEGSVKMDPHLHRQLASCYGAAREALGWNLI